MTAGTTVPLALAVLVGALAFPGSAAAASSAPAALPPGCGTVGPQVVCTFSTPTPIGSPILFDVPTGVTTVAVTARGASGGRGNITLIPLNTVIPQAPGGLGGTASASLGVDPAQDLQIRVGGRGEDGALTGGAGGANGGGPGGAFPNAVVVALAGGGGGGGSEVRPADGSTPLTADPLIAAGGGGGGGGALPFPGGAGGGLTGGDGSPFAPNDGEGGTQVAGGLLGGTRGQGGPGSNLVPSGGGGGGKFGGGGSVGLSGGGGSGFGPAGVQYGVAAAPGDGEVVISYAPPAAAAPTPTDDDDDDHHKKKHKRHKPTGPTCAITPAILPNDTRYFTGGC